MARQRACRDVIEHTNVKPEGLWPGPPSATGTTSRWRGAHSIERNLRYRRREQNSHLSSSAWRLWGTPCGKNHTSPALTSSRDDAQSQADTTILAFRLYWHCTTDERNRSLPLSRLSRYRPNLALLTVVHVNYKLDRRRPACSEIRNKKSWEENSSFLIPCPLPSSSCHRYPKYQARLSEIRLTCR